MTFSEKKLLDLYNSCNDTHKKMILSAAEIGFRLTLEDSAKKPNGMLIAFPAARSCKAKERKV